LKGKLYEKRMGWVGRDGIKIIMGDGFATILDNIIQPFFFLIKIVLEKVSFFSWISHKYINSIHDLELISCDKFVNCKKKVLCNILHIPQKIFVLCF
jgi:hypothetical protein